MIIMSTVDINILKQLPSLVNKYRMPSFSQATLQSLTSFLPYVVLWLAMYFLLDISYILVLVLAIVNAFFLVRIFIIQHDCGHQSFTKSNKINDLLGQIASVLTWMPYQYRAKGHEFHHNHNAILRDFRDIGDIETLTVEEYSKLSPLKKIGYRLFRSAPVMFFIIPLRYILIHNRLPLIRLQWRHKEYISLIYHNLMLIVFYGWLWWIIGFKALFMIQFPVLLCFGTIAIWFFYIQHQHEATYKARQDKREYVRAAVQWSSFYDLPRFFHRLTGNIGYHHIHHLNSLVPSYQLARCFREQPLLQKVANRLTFRQSLRCMWHHLRDEQQQKMISFRAYYRLYGRRQQVA